MICALISGVLEHFEASIIAILTYSLNDKCYEGGPSWSVKFIYLFLISAIYPATNTDCITKDKLVLAELMDDQ